MGFSLTVLLLAILSGCSSSSSTASRTVLVAAAADLIKVSRPLSTAFERSSKSRVSFAFGSSGDLEQQIRRGASFDVYVPAARSYCQSLERDGFASGKDKIYAFGRLVGWSKHLHLHSLNDLAGREVRRIAIANPEFAPYGLAAQQALQSAGLWSALQPKIVYGENVAHALEMATTGNADVALVALALAHNIGGFSFGVDKHLYRPLAQAAVVLKGSRNKEAAGKFLDFLLSRAAQRIFQEYGFRSPERGTGN